jgi:hypothetical protein
VGSTTNSNPEPPFPIQSSVAGGAGTGCPQQLSRSLKAPQTSCSVRHMKSLKLRRARSSTTGEHGWPLGAAAANWVRAPPIAFFQV